MIRAMHPTDGAELYALIGNMFFGGQSNPCGISHIVRCRTARGESFMAMVRARIYLKEGGKMWALGTYFQPLPMSRFLFPLAKPLGPAEGPASQAAYATLSTFEEPTQPQTCKAVEVMTRDALAFHFRSLTDSTPTNKELAPHDLFLEEAPKSDTDDNEDEGWETMKKPRKVIDNRSTGGHVTSPSPPAPAFPAPPADPQASALKSQIPHHRNDTEPLPSALPSLNLSRSEMDVLDSFLTIGDDDGDNSSVDSASSWSNWAECQPVGDDFWQAVGGLPGIAVHNPPAGLKQG